MPLAILATLFSAATDLLAVDILTVSFVYPESIERERERDLTS
jgi:hypothetical protein